MGQVHTLPKYDQIWILMFGYCQLKIKYAAQIMSVSELFIKMSVNKESREDFCAIVHIYAGILFHILEKRIGFTKQIQVKAKLVWNKYENKLVF